MEYTLVKAVQSLPLTINMSKNRSVNRPPLDSVFSSLGTKATKHENIQSHH